MEVTWTLFGTEVNPLRPLAIKMDAAGEKELLTAGLEEQGKLIRKWSPWQQTDPVELFNKGRVVPG